MRPASTADWLSLFAMSICWGSSFLLIELALVSLTPVALVAWRIAVATLLLVPVAALAGERLPQSWSSWRHVVVLSLLGNVAPFLLISWGQQHIDSAVAAVILAIMPLATLVMATLFLTGQTISGRKWFGVAVGFGGVVTLMNPGAIERDGYLALFGALAVLLAAVFYGANAVYAKTRPGMSPLSLTAAVMLVSTLLMAPLAVSEVDQIAWSTSGSSLIAATVLGVFSTALATLLYFRLIHGPGPTFVANVNYLVPAWAVLLGTWLLSEPMTPTRAAGMALVLLGLFLGEWPIGKKRRGRHSYAGNHGSAPAGRLNNTSTRLPS